MFPDALSLMKPQVPTPAFMEAWQLLMQEHCHNHPVWQTEFVKLLQEGKTNPTKLTFDLAKEWSRNMIVGSYCFPRYVAALAARSPLDAVRHGLLENAWDESGGPGHTERSHFWLAVQLGRLLGLTDEKITHGIPLPEAQSYTDAHYAQCTTSDFAFGLGMLSLIEEFTTPEFTLIRDALLASIEPGVGMAPKEFAAKGGTYYFDANIEDDERHREEMPRIVATLLVYQGVNLEDSSQITNALTPIAQGVKYSADFRLQFFDGITTRVGAHQT
jgi:pyrroloquinoline quinone (PQQ) biosynthesis protein C